MVKLKLVTEYFDELEIRTDEQREENLAKVLPEHLKYVRDHCDGMKERLSDLDLGTFYSIKSLQKLPVLRKNDLALSLIHI